MDRPGLIILTRK